VSSIFLRSNGKWRRIILYALPFLKGRYMVDFLSFTDILVASLNLVSKLFKTRQSVVAH
jgi:hypothetical protein